MCIKKMLLILLLINISLVALYSQTDVLGNDKDSASLDEIRNAIEEERISQINELLATNNIASIETIFSEDEEAYFALIKEKDVQYSKFIREMMFKAYRNVASLQDDLLFIDCKKALYAQDWDMVALKANDLLRRYPETNRKDTAIRYWKIALFKSGKDQDYVNLVERYPEFELASQKFRYGQSLYNIGRLDDAQRFLEEAAADDEYTLRASASLALISLAKNNIDEATMIFELLQKNYTPETPYYDFILLSIARLFSHFGDPETALTYYQAYNQLNKNNTSEVIYEIGIAYRKSGDLDKAKATFERLLSSKNADDFYVQTLYNLILIDQELNNGQTASTLMTEFQARVDDYFSDLLKNRNLMNEIRTLRNNLLMESEKSRIDILKEQIRGKEEEILVNQANLEQKISFLDPRSVSLIKELELTFIERTETYFVELDLIDQYRNRPKDELIAIAAKDRSNKEEDYLLGITEELLSDIESPNDDQFLRAYWYANQLYLKKKYIVNLSTLVEKTKSYPAKNSELRQLLQEEKENLDEIQVKAKFDLAEFPNLSQKQELAAKKADEFLAEESKLESKRKKVIDTYYETIADKAETEVKDKFKDLDKNISIYTNSFNKFNKIKNEQQTYVDFIALDLEYRKITENFRKRRDEADRDSIALTDTEINNFTDQFERIYNNSSNFIFKNKDFASNFKLYFNMAEIATVIYSNNYNLIYNNYSKVLELNPNYPQKDVILYNLAYYKNQILDIQIANLREEKMKDENYFYQPRPEEVTKSVGKYKEVIQNYLELTKDVNSKYQIESMLRLAKLYWDIAVDADDPAKYVNISIKLYNQIYALGNQDQKYEALFQRAWHKLAIQNYESAISDLELLLANEALFTDYQRNKYSLSEDILVYSLNAIDIIPEIEIKSYSYVQNSLFSLFDENTAERVFQKLLEKKRIFDEFEDIIKLYDARSRVDIYAINNPVYTDSIITTMGKYAVEIGDSLDTRGEREYLKAITRYGFGSDWYEYNKTNDIAPYVKVVQKGLDDFVIPSIYKRIDANPSVENIKEFVDATNMYASYVGFNEDIRQRKLKIYDQNSISTLVKYVITQKDTIAYNYGIKEVYNYISRNPESEIRDDLEKNAYSWAFNITAITDTTKFDTINYSPSQIDDLVRQRRSNYIAIADRYYDYLVNSGSQGEDDTIYKLLYWRGVTKYQMGDNEGARLDFLACNDLNISNEFKESIFRNLAEIYKDAGDIDTSTEYYARAKEFVAEDKKKDYETEIYNNRVAKVNLLQNTNNQEDKVKAALEMEKMIKSSVIDDAKKEEFRRKAIALYAEGGDYDTAIKQLIQEGNNSTGIEEAWSNYGAAITLSDSLGNVEKTKEIEDIYMQRFPNDQQTFVFLINRLVLVQDSTLATYDPLLAADKMIEIYERASKDGDKLDISSGDLSSPEDYYFNAIAMKCRVLGKAEQAQEWIDFNLKFPNYQRVIVLNTICQLFEEVGNQESYLTYIKILYATDNTNPRFPRYAFEQLSPINEEITKAYRRKDWTNMLSLIEKYKERANTFVTEGIPAQDIAIPISLERYTAYTNEYEREQEKKAFLADLENRYEKFMTFISVPADDDSRVKVNNATTWNTHLYGNNKRINNFVTLVKKQFELIDNDADRVLNSDLLSADEKRIEIYKLDFAKFKIAQYSGDLIYNQISKFLELPNGQYVNYQNIIYARTDLTYDQQDEILYAYEDEIFAVRDQYSLEFDNIGIGYARSIYESYIDGVTSPLPRSQEVLAFLQKLGVSEVAPKDEIEITFDATMRRDFSNISESVINDSYRDFLVYTIPAGDSLHLEKDIDCPIMPMAARMRFVDEGDVWFNEQVTFTFSANDKPVDLYSLSIPDGIIEDSLSAFPYLYRSLSNDNNLASLNYQKGKNSISITLVNNSFDEISVGFNFAMIYDKEKLFIHNNAVKYDIVTDNTWLGADSLETLSLDDPSWAPVRFGNLEVDYYQLTAFQNSIAIPIWYGEEVIDLNSTVVVDSLNTLNANQLVDTLAVASLQDSTSMVEQSTTTEQATVKYFIKEFEVDGKVIDGILYFLANETANVFLNGEQIGFDEYYYFEPPDAPYIDISPEYFVQGKNVLIFQVNSPSNDNALIVDLQFRTIKERR